MPKSNFLCNKCGQPCVWGWKPKRDGSGGRAWFPKDKDTLMAHVCSGQASYGRVNVDVEILKTQSVYGGSVDAETIKAENAASLKDEVKDSQIRHAINVVKNEAVVQVHQAAATAIGTVNDVLDVALNDAKNEFKAMLPIQHEIVIKKFDGEFKFYGRPHYKFKTICTIASTRLNIMMVGPAGGGKTTIGQMLATAFGLAFTESSMGPATSQYDLVGYKSPSGAFVEGLLNSAFEFGGVVLLDELDNTNPSVLSALNSLLGNGHFTFANGRRVAKHADFILIAAANTYGRGADRVYVGRNQLDGATLNRFIFVNWDYDEDAERVWAGTGYDWWIDYVQKVRRFVFNAKMRVIVSPRASIYGVMLLKAGQTFDEIKEELIWQGMGVDDRSKIEEGVK